MEHLPQIKLSDRKLGRGLSALLGDNKIKSSILNIQDDDKVEKIDINLIVTSSFQPRNYFDENELQDLANSIMEHGVLQPIITRKTADNKYEIIAGERRYRASLIAKLKQIPTIIRKISNQQALEIAIIENIQRADLSVTEEAEGYKKLIDDFAYTQDFIAKKVGKSRSHIANLLRLLTLPQAVRNFLDEKKISMGHARAIINSSNPLELVKKIIENNLNVRDVENLVREEKNVASPVLMRSESKVKFINNQHLSNLESKFSEIFGLESKIYFNAIKNSGKLTIKFNEIEEIEEIIKKY
jgi:ParB family chromosome partitioning protein